MHRLATLLFAAAGFACASDARAQDAPPFPASSVPVRGARVESFVPTGWKVAREASGDLNGDGRADRVIHVVQAGIGYDPDAIAAAPESHALLILLADGGGWRRAGMATKLQTIVPQWGLNLTIRRGVLMVEQNFGMTEVMDVTHRFRLDPATGRFLLIGRDQMSYTRPQEASDPVKTSENYLTGQRLITTGHYTASGGYRETERREAIPRTRAYFDDIDEDTETG
jgi:hypothetical protein